MVPRLRAIVIALTMVSAPFAVAQEAVSPSTSSSQGLERPPVAGPKQEQTTQHHQEAARDAAVQHDADKPPQDQNGSGNGSGGDDGKRIGHFGSYTPEEITAAFTIALAGATVALVGATILLAVATVGLWRETKKLAAQAIVASEDTREAIAVSKRSADAAEKSAEAALAGIEAQKAVVVHKGFNFTSTNNAMVENQSFGRSCLICIEFVNVGPTVALNLTLSIRLEIIKADQEPPHLEREFPEEAGGINLGTGIVGATKWAVVTHDDMVASKNRQKRIFIYSAARYRTIQAPNEFEVDSNRFEVHVNTIDTSTGGKVNYSLSLVAI